MGDAGEAVDQNAVVGGGGGAAAVAEDEFSGSGGVGNRWPRQETLALLKIRSEMDSTFRDSTLKAPLWELISRKLGEFGYKRSAKKCKEKFENVYKYHKRTKDGRRATGKSDKTYRFFDELEAFDLNHNHHHHHLPPPPPPPPQKPDHHHHISINNTNPTTTHKNDHHGIDNSSPASSWSTASDEEFRGAAAAAAVGGRPSGGKRKREWKHFFRRLTRQVVRKQEEMQHKFLEAVERRDAERASRDQAWRAHEMTRISADHATLARDRSASAAKDAALISFLQKLSGGNQTLIAATPNNIDSVPTTTTTNAVPISSVPPRPTPLPVFSPSPSSRWPKPEVEALINIRTTLELKYHENGPKGPLWEEISAGMKRVGFNRSAKRCKEKWENINKYFKKVKDNTKRRPEDSKTCPYFHKLDALYRLKNGLRGNDHVDPIISNGGSGAEVLMVQPESQWPMISEEEEEEEEEDEAVFDRSDSSSAEVDNNHHTNNDHGDEIMIVDMKVQEVVVRATE